MVRQSSERARFEIMMEEMRSQFQMVIERVSFLDQKIDSVRHDLSQRFGIVEQAVSMGFRDVRADIRRLEGRMDGFGGWVKGHDQLHASSRS